MNPDIRVKVCMSLMRALWGEITPEVRAVLARPKGAQGFCIELYLDGDSLEEFMESAWAIEGEVMGDFPVETDISHKLIRLDAPARIPIEEDGVVVFLRKEVPGA